MQAAGCTSEIGPKKRRRSWARNGIRYVLHVLVLFQILHFSTTWLPEILARIRGMHSQEALAQFLFSHLLAISFWPALTAGILIGATFRHRAASYVWIVPFGLFIFQFLMHTPGIYPTIIWESDFVEALKYLFGTFKVPPDLKGHIVDFLRGYTQLNSVAPAYAGLAYSLGSWVGMNRHFKWLQDFMMNF